MLPKENRLTDDYDFRKVRRRGTKVTTPFFALYCLRMSLSGPSRFGFVISTKADKRATARNRVKRLFREGVRSLFPRVKDGYDIAFWVRRRALSLKADELWPAIEKALEKAEVMSNK